MEHLICYLSILKITEVFNTAILIGVYILRNLISGPLHGDLRGGGCEIGHQRVHFYHSFSYFLHKSLFIFP